MRLGTFPTNGRSEVDDLFSRLFDGGESPSWSWAGHSVPTDVFHMDDKLVIRMDLPGVNPDDVEVTVQESTLLINGRRSFPFDPDGVRFARRGVFYGEFTQRVSLGKGLDLESINAAYDNGVLTIAIPYSADVQPKKISIEIGDGTKSLNA